MQHKHLKVNYCACIPLFIVVSIELLVCVNSISVCNISFGIKNHGVKVKIKILSASCISPHTQKISSECYQSLTAHQHQKGHTVPKQVITIPTSIQVTTV